MDRVDSWLFASPWRLLLVMFGLVGVALAVILPIATHFEKQESEPRQQWCRAHGLGIVGISRNAGKSIIREVVCIDQDRRLVLPE